MRHWLWFVVAAVIAIAGFVASGLYVLPRISSIDAGMIRIVVPGSGAIVLDKPGTYTVFHEKRSTVDGQYYASESVPGLRIELVSDRDGTPVRLVEPSTSTEYTIGNRKGASIFAFTIDQPGRYRLTTRMSSGQAVLAIGQGTFGAIFAIVGGALAIAFGGIAVAGIIVALTLWQRSKAPAKA